MMIRKGGILAHTTATGPDYLDSFEDTTTLCENAHRAILLTIEDEFWLVVGAVALNNFDLFLICVFQTK